MKSMEPVKALTEEQRELILAESLARAEAARPKTYIRVLPQEADEEMDKAKDILTNLVQSLPEEHRQDFRLEWGSKVMVIKKGEGAQLLIIPKIGSIKTSIITGIIKYYTEYLNYSTAQIGALLDILNGEVNVIPEILATVKVNKKSKKVRVKKERVKKERVKKVKEDITKEGITNTAGLDIIKLSTICAELGLDPKKARMKLRKHYNKPANGWEWSIDQVEGIKDFLK